MPGLDTLTDELRSDILEGVLAPGERLIELQLSEQYDCGRAAVRAALVELASEGLVERAANRGATVRRISVSEAIQITEARAALEGLLAANAARNASGRQRADLLDLVQEMRAAVDRNDGVAYSDLNGRFHGHIRRIAHHEVAGELVANLRNRAAHHQYRLALMPGRPETSVDQHAAVAEAIIAGDDEAASAAMETHLRSVAEVLRQWGDVAP